MLGIWGSGPQPWSRGGMRQDLPARMGKTSPEVEPEDCHLHVGWGDFDCGDLEQETLACPVETGTGGTVTACPEALGLSSRL